MVIVSCDEDNSASGSRLNVSHSCELSLLWNHVMERSEMGESLFILLGGQVFIVVGPFLPSGEFSYVRERCL